MLLSKTSSASYHCTLVTRFKEVGIDLNRGQPGLYLTPVFKSPRGSLFFAPNQPMVNSGTLIFLTTGERGGAIRWSMALSDTIGGISGMKGNLVNSH